MLHPTSRSRFRNKSQWNTDRGSRENHESFTTISQSASASVPTIHYTLIRRLEVINKKPRTDDDYTVRKIQSEVRSSKAEDVSARWHQVQPLVRANTKHVHITPHTPQAVVSGVRGKLGVGWRVGEGGGVGECMYTDSCFRLQKTPNHAASTQRQTRSNTAFKLNHTNHMHRRTYWGQGLGWDGGCGFTSQYTIHVYTYMTLHPIPWYERLRCQPPNIFRQINGMVQHRNDSTLNHQTTHCFFTNPLKIPPYSSVRPSPTALRRLAHTWTAYV
jgi:hypothetical protein